MGRTVRSSSGRNKVKTEDITRVHERKGLLSKEVVKSEKSSLVDRCLWDHVRPLTWDNCAVTFPLSTEENVFGQTQVGTNAG